MLEGLWYNESRSYACVLEMSENNTVLGNDTLQKILGYEIPMTCIVMYMCNLSEGIIHPTDHYLTKILLVAANKAITKNWGKQETPTQDLWTQIIEGIYAMEKLTFKLQLQEPQIEEKWEKWTLFKTEK